MEISRVGNKTNITSEKVTVSNKKDFSQSFNHAKDRKSHEELKKLQENIKNRGIRLTVTKSYADVREYKKLIKDFITSALDYMYSVKKDISFWQTQYFITVDTIDKKLEELTQEVINQENATLDIAKTIDEITGLVLDIYK